MRIQTKLSLLFVGLALVVLVTVGVLSSITLGGYLRSQVIRELDTQAAEIEFVIRNAAVSDTGLYRYFQHLAESANLRLTLIDSSGNVLFESALPQERLSLIENHLSRPEVRDARLRGSGMDIRQSATLKLDMLYFARKISEPFPTTSRFRATVFVRIGIPLTQLNSLLSDLRSKILLVSLGALIIVAIIAVLVARKLSAPLREMDTIVGDIRLGKLDKRLPVRSKDEIGKLSETLNNLIDQLNAEIVKLKQLERVRSEFLGNVSHELRTPIFALQGMLETLLNGAIDDTAVNRSFVERALHNAQRLNTLLGDLIEISRIESGEMKMSFRYFQPGEFLSQIVAEMQPLAHQRGVRLVLQSAENQANVLGDRDRLKQVMLNLIDNAIKYTAAGGEITVIAQPINAGLRIAVQDTGIGISAEHLPRIFERFYRVDKERSREAGGTGLGLAIVKHIVEAHGSRVEVQSEVGNGSTFSFDLRA